MRPAEALTPRQPPMARYESCYYRTVQVLLWGVFRMAVRLRTVGMEHIPMEGSVILASNHQSYLDPVLIGAAVPRELQFMARDTLFHTPLLARFIRSVNAFPVKRGTADLTAIKQSLRMLKDGKALVLFPEATRTPDGRIREIQAGVITLARRSGSPIVPAAVEGAYQVWPRTAKLPRPGAIWLGFAAPISAERLAELDDQAAAEMLTAEVRRLHNELRQRAGRPPFDYAGARSSQG